MSIFRRDQGTYPGPQAQPPTRQPPAHGPEPGMKEPPPVPAPVVPGKADVSAPQPAVVPPNRDAAAIVDKKSEITGTLHSQGNVVIEGCFQGEIEAKETVWVEKGAQTQAQLRANDVIISGTFNGEIVCQHRVQIASTATISGEIKTPVLVIEEGATVNCRFTMSRTRR